MTTTTSDTTEVRKSIVVKATRERAWSVFTDGFDSWWPREHHLLDAELDHVAIEPHVGGRCYEATTDGRTCTWGRVLTWDPPATLVYTWEIQPDWGVVPPEGGPASTVTVTFTEVEGGTRVELVHAGLEVHGEGWQKMRDAIDGEQGWNGML
ncbi:MAG TPA: SRPBCC family protein, partial [Mycobacteriales bacterium]|nr:SRPBCC family protein [Mycobacteriales bacterium]